MAEIKARSQPPIFFCQVEDGDRRCQSDLDILWRQNWWERSWCLNSNALLTFANVFVALNFVTLLDFSEQGFLLETVMRSYSRRLDFLELNPYVDYSFHIITKKKKQSWVPQNKIMTHEWNYNFYGRGCCDSRDHGDPHRFRLQKWHWHDGTKCSETDIFRKVEHKTNKQRRAALFLSIHFWPGHVKNWYCNIIQWI